MFAELAHGGATLAGKAWDANGVNTALGEDYGSSLNLVDKNGNAKASVTDSCPSWLTDTSEGNLCSGQVLFHGDHTAFDTVTGGGTNDGASSNLGAPLFNGWPLWSSTVHQQVYYKWLERAWLGGLRLMVMDTVTNEALCKSGTTVSGADGLTLNAITGVLGGTPAPGTGGVYNITIAANNGIGSPATQSFTLNVQDFTISVSPASETIPAGVDGTYTISVASLGGLAGNVSLTCSGAPPNSTCTASPGSVALNGTSKFTIHLLPPKNVDLGTFTVVFSGKFATLTHTANVTLTVK
jgi:Putative Ig domain